MTVQTTMRVIEKPSKKATVYEVAKLAGVSPITAARAFNGKLPVSKKTKDIILKAAEILNYKPNPLARGLNGGPTNSLALVWSMGFPLLPSDVFYKLVSSVQEHGDYYLQLIGVHPTASEVARTLEECASRGLDGVVLCVGEVVADKNIQKTLKQFRAGLAISDGSARYDCDQIVWDRGVAIRQIVQHFKDSGRRKPGVLIDLAENKSKVDAFFQSALDCGFSIDRGSIIDCPVNADTDMFAVLFKECLDSHKFDCDAVLCQNDEWAATVTSMLAARGTRVPQDVAVVGFDNRPVSRFVTPQLATVDRCHDELGQAIDRMLFARLEKPDLPVQTVNVGMRFVLRDSACGANVVSK